MSSLLSNMVFASHDIDVWNTIYNCEKGEIERGTREITNCH